MVQSVVEKAPSLYVTTGKLLLHFVTFDKYILPLTAILMESFPLKIYSNSGVVDWKNKNKEVSYSDISEAYTDLV